MKMLRFSPWPDITYRSPKYWEMVEFAASEAKRLGLEIGMHNCVGYSATGGPWVTVDKSMQKVVWTQTPVVGPTEFHATLAKPKTFEDYYGDIAVLAVPDRAGVDGKLPVIQTGEIVDLTAKMQVGGSLDWSVPEGKWVIVRPGICLHRRGTSSHSRGHDGVGGWTSWTWPTRGSITKMCSGR